MFPSGRMSDGPEVDAEVGAQRLADDILLKKFENFDGIKDLSEDELNSFVDSLRSQDPEKVKTALVQGAGSSLEAFNPSETVVFLKNTKRIADKLGIGMAEVIHSEWQKNEVKRIGVEAFIMPHSKALEAKYGFRDVDEFMAAFGVDQSWRRDQNLIDRIQRSMKSMGASTETINRTIKEISGETSV